MQYNYCINICSKYIACKQKTTKNCNLNYETHSWNLNRLYIAVMGKIIYFFI